MKKVCFTLFCLAGLSGAALASTLSDDSLSTYSSAAITQDLKLADQLYGEGKAIYARPLYRKHVAALSPVQKVRLASSMIWGDGELAEVTLAAELLQQQYAAGNKAAAPLLGMLYYRGKGLTQDSVKGAALIQAAVAAGDAWGYYMNAIILETKEDYAGALENFKMAYEGNHVDAATAVGLLYEEGNLGKPNYSKALDWYKKGARRGSGSAYARWGWLGYGGNKGMKEDKELTFINFKKAEEYGDYRHTAALGLGHCYSFGEGVKVNIDSALYYYREAGRYGRGRGYSRIGYMYEKGTGVKQQADSSLFNYARGADLGDSWACFRIATVFSDGLLVPQNYPMAAQALKTGADLGDPDCMLELARYYRKGLGMDADLDKSRAILQRPEFKESGAALYQLALIEDSLHHEKEYAALMKQAIAKGSGEALYQQALIVKGSGKDATNNKLYDDYLLAAVKAGNADAIFSLGIEFAYGTNRGLNTQLGKELIVQAARLGNRNALDFIGLNAKSFGAIAEKLAPARSGESEEKDYTTDYEPPVSGISKSAMDGNPEGQYMMAMKYINGVGVRKNLSLAIQWLQQAAAQGNAESYFQLGYMYETGQGFQQSYTDAMTWYELAAEKNVPMAINNIGLFYCKGKGVPMDKEKAATYFERAAALGNALALNNLGYYFIYDLPQSAGRQREGRQLIIQSAQAGSDYGQYNLALLLLNGTAGEKDQVKGDFWLKKAADQGNLDAMTTLALRYYKKNPKDPASCELFTRIVPQTKEALALVWLYDICGRNDVLSKADEQQLLERLLRDKHNLKKRDKIALMEFYRFGIGTERDMNKAIALGIELESIKEDVEVELELARLFTNKQQPDYAEAARWCAKAVAKKGEDAVYDMSDYYGIGKHMAINDSLIYYYFKTETDKGDVKARNYLGYLYELGRGVPQDLKQAAYWLEQGAQNGDTMAMKELIYIYGGSGGSAPKEEQKMVFWMEKAANAGSSVIQYTLGNYYFFNKNGKEKEKALQWYEKAAAQGDGDAMNNLGECYYIGLGTPKDYEKARYYYQQAIDHGYAFAKISLGTLYLKGHGVEKDKEKARQLYEAACDENIPQACVELSKLK